MSRPSQRGAARPSSVQQRQEHGVRKGCRRVPPGRERRFRDCRDVKGSVRWVSLLSSLAKRKTPDNAKHVALAQQGLALPHDLLLQQRQLRLSEMRLDAIAASIPLGTNLSASTVRLMAHLDLSAATLRKARLGAFTQHNQGPTKYRALPSVRFALSRFTRSRMNLIRCTWTPGTSIPILKQITWRGYADYRLEAHRGADGIVEPVDTAGRLGGLPELLARPNAERYSYDLVILVYRGSSRPVQAIARHAISPQTTLNAIEYIKAITVEVALVGALTPSGFISCAIEHPSRYTQKGCEMDHAMITCCNAEE